VYVATPLEVCEDRDTKGLYQRARAGELQEFTGISDPYESPIAPEITLNTTEMAVEQNVESMMAEIISRDLFEG
jgi:adenylylsulfate kinase